MSYWEDYAYVDAYYDPPKQKKPVTWVRIQVPDVGKRIVKKANNVNCFTTIQRFKDAMSLLELQRSEKKRRPKKLGEAEARDARVKEGDQLPDQQIHYHGLYFDFDCDAKKNDISLEEALGRSQADAKKLVKWFTDTFELDAPHIQVWFSGKKGFHVLVRPEPFGIQPHNHLTYIVRNIAFELADALKLETLDRSVYTARRMWRVPNTVHPGSGKFKVELTVHELLNWNVTRILEESVEPRYDTSADIEMAVSHVWEEREYDNVLVDKDAESWYQERYAHYEACWDMKQIRPRRPILTRDEAGDDNPVCIMDLMNNGPKDGGPMRNRVLLPLAGFLYDSGASKGTAHEEIEKWTKAFYPEPDQIRDRLSNGRSVVESAYRGQVRFSCRFIRSCGGSGEKGKVECVGESSCSWVKDVDDQEPEMIPMVHLSEAAKGCYNGVKLRTAIHVATIATRSFQLPTSGIIACHPDATAKICNGCPNNEADTMGVLKWAFDAEDRHVLNMINVNDNIKKGTIKSKAGVPQKCYRCTVKVEEHGNVEEIQVIPMVDYAHAYLMGGDVEEGKVTSGDKHVVALAYYMGLGIEANKKYIIEATVFGHPKDQRSCFLFDKLEPAQNDIDQFEMTPALHDKLKIFQPRKGQSVEDKLLEIHRDFTVNVHRIGGRFDLSVAVDLCYHSVIGFKFIGDMVNKGWFELLVLGETSTGKTTLIERMMRHFGLGELIAGEDSKRTGLIYASIQLQGQWVLIWGKVPQNDRRLLVIDEFAGIPPEEVAKMTQMRSEGKARGGGVNAHYETWARTRMIFLTNPRDNRGSLVGYNYGIEAINDLFDQVADLRRIDLAMVMAKEDVPSAMLNKRWDKVDLPQRYSADLCRNLVLWAWSRNPRHVQWAEDVEQEVLDWAERLGDTYECDLPLAERADLKHKIARISVACAARMFSTDESAKRVIVKKEHVRFVAQFIDRAYRKNAMGYFEFARKYKQDNYFSEEKKALIKKTLHSFGEESKRVIGAVREVNYLTKPMLVDMVNLEPEELKRLWKFLVGERLIRKVSRGYRKTGAFKDFLGLMADNKGPKFKGGLSDGFEGGGDFDQASRDQTRPFGEEDETDVPMERGTDVKDQKTPRDGSNKGYEETTSTNTSTSSDTGEPDF